MSGTEHIDIDKDDWIYLYRSSRLKTARIQGYECKELYLKERLKLEYPGFKINERSKATKLDLPPVYALEESSKWENSYVASQAFDGECIVLDDYLDSYQIISKPWYLFYESDLFITSAVAILTCTISGAFLMILFRYLYPAL